MKNYIAFCAFILSVTWVVALPTSTVVKRFINHEVISPPEEKIYPKVDEEFINDETETNRSKKSATTFCVEIKSGTPECVPCQPVMMGVPQSQIVYVTENNTISDTINNTVIHREGEVPSSDELPCMKDQIFLISSLPQTQPTVSIVPVPVVHQVSQTPQIFAAKKPFLETYFPELLNDSNVQIQPLIPIEDSPSMFNSQYPQMFPSNLHPPSDIFAQFLQNTFPINNNDYLNINADQRGNIFPQSIIPQGPSFEFTGPMENYGMGQNFGFGGGEQLQYPSVNNQPGQVFTGEVALSQQYPSVNNQPEKVFTGGVGEQHQHPSVNNQPEKVFDGGIGRQHQHPSVNNQPEKMFTGGVGEQHQHPSVNNQPGQVFTGGIGGQHQHPSINNHSGQVFTGGVGEQYQHPSINNHPEQVFTGGIGRQHQHPSVNNQREKVFTGGIGGQHQHPSINNYPGQVFTGGIGGQHQYPSVNNQPGQVFTGEVVLPQQYPSVNNQSGQVFTGGIGGQHQHPSFNNQPGQVFTGEVVLPQQYPSVNNQSGQVFTGGIGGQHQHPSVNNQPGQMFTGGIGGQHQHPSVNNQPGQMFTGGIGGQHQHPSFNNQPGQVFTGEVVLPQQYPSVNNQPGQVFTGGIGGQHQHPSINNQPGQEFTGGVLPLQQYPPLFNYNHPSGQMFINGAVGQFPSQEPVNLQRPVNFNGIQTQYSHFSNMDVVTGQDGRNYYLMPTMINGSPQLCLQPGVINNQQVENFNQQPSMQPKNASVINKQWSPVNKQWFSREVEQQDNEETLKIPKVQTTVAPVKLGPQSLQDTKGKGGSSVLLSSHLKGSSSLPKSNLKSFGKGQNKDSKANDKSEMKRGIKRETEIPVDK